jgi:membrane protein insertase Oxa1/YidC/SpoIIIJ
MEEQGAPTSETMAKLRPYLLHGFPVILFLFMFWQPAALQLTFLTSGILINIQGVLMRRPAVRKRFGLTPLMKSRAGSASPLSMWSAMNPKPTPPKPVPSTRQQILRQQAARRKQRATESESRY